MRTAAALLVVLLGAAACEPAGVREPRLDFARFEVRPTEPDALWRYEANTELEHLDAAGGGFRVHFTREGTHAVPTRDLDQDGVPDYVQDVAAIYDEVAAFYQDQLGYRAPLGDAGLAGDDGGDGRFDVYLLDFGHQADGAFRTDACLTDGTDRCLGHIVQENDFAGYGYPSLAMATRILGSHEYFHAIQAAYDTGQGSVLSEGTAVWATEAFDESLPDLEAFVDGYLGHPDRSLDVPLPGPVDPFSYGSGLFFRFLSERYDDGLLRALWERVENGAGLPGAGDDPADPYWLNQLDAVLAADHGTGFGQAFREFAVWNLATADRADPERAYANGALYPPVLMEDVYVPYTDDRMRVFYASAQYLRVDPLGRDALTARLVDLPLTEEDDREGLVVLGAVWKGGRWEVTEAPNEVAFEVRGAEEVVVAVVNGARSGSSRRPGLCVGDAAEVDACEAWIAPPPEEPEPVCPGDPGCPDEGGGGEAPGGCGCGTSGGGSSASAALFAALAALLRKRPRPGARRRHLR